MIEVNVTERWRETFSGGHIGMLLLGNIDNARRATPLDACKREVESNLREKFKGFGRAELLDLEVLKAYKAYYKKFNKTYHVQLQLESILLKGRSLPNVNPLVDANFAAELESMILTAGHDADRLELPLSIDATDGTEVFTQMNGAEKRLKAKDMMMRDARGVVCTIIYGQDLRTPISPETKRALYVAYVPPGIKATLVNEHMLKIEENVKLFAPEVRIEYQRVHSSDLP